MDWKITKKQKIRKLLESIPKNIKESKIISGDWQGMYASGVVVIDHIKGKAEVHEKMRDVWYILSGKGKIVLGGKLVNPKSSKKGEWSAKKISGGKTFIIEAGDVIDISPGITHQFDAPKNRIEALLVKVPV